MTRRVVTPGLAPSTSLAPSASLAPADTIYGGAPITPHLIYMNIGDGTSLVDVSAYVEFGETVSYTYGRSSWFEDTSPGTFTFTLNNSDGRFTPDNPTSPLVTKVTEGMQVAWTLGTRTIYGSILSVEIPADEANWHQLVVTCDDMLGTAGRHNFTSIADGLLARAQPKALWKLDDGTDQWFGKETFGDGLGMFSLYRSNPSSTTQAVTFGVQQTPGLPGTAVTVAAGPNETNWFGTRHGNTVTNTTITSPYLGTGTAGQSVKCGFYNFWVYPGSTINFAVVPAFGVENPGYAWSAQVRCTPSSYTVKPGTSTGYTYNLTAAEQLKPHYISMRYNLVWQTSGNYWALFVGLFVDASLKGQVAWYDPQHGYQIPTGANSLSPVEVSVSCTGTSTTGTSGTVQRISYTALDANAYGLESYAVAPTLDGRRQAVDFIGEDINTAVYNGPLSTAPIGFPDDTGGSLLDLLNEIARTETGHLFVDTKPVGTGVGSYIEIRARDRPATPETVFNVTADLDGPPTFVRDITNVAAQVDVSGPNDTVTVYDPTVTGRYITAGLNETVLYAGDDDLRGWGQDRLYRGKNRAVRTQQFTVDAANTPTDRSADLLALVPGDRVQLAGLPAPRLGFATWDGWILGGAEAHDPNHNRFTYQLTPTQPNPAVYDTDRFGGGTDIRLGNTYNATATSVVYNTFGPTMSNVFPYTIQIDSEQMTVTGLTGMTLTVVRGVNGTTPASHTVNSVIEIAPAPLYGY